MIPRRNAIVTGATGSVGRELVSHLVATGWRVGVPYRGRAGWQALHERAGASGLLVGFEADVSRPDHARRFVDQAAAALGSIDAVALAAGGWAGGARFEQAPGDEWPAMMRDNLDSAVHLCRAVLPALLPQGGSVVAIGSLAAHTGGAGMAAYAVAKCALHALVRVLAAENRDRGVRFNAVLPGTIDTPANRHAMPSADRLEWVAPEALVRTIAFLLSPESAPVTGALVPVEGGGGPPGGSPD